MKVYSKIVSLFLIALTCCINTVHGQGNRRFPIAPITQTTYDPNKVASTITLLNNNLSYQELSSGDGFVRSTTSHSTATGGAVYVYEVTIQSGGASINEPAGIVSSTVTNLVQEPASIAQVGAINVSCTYYGGNGNIYTSNAVVLQATGIAYANLDVIAVAFDSNASTVQFFKNGTAVGTPVSVPSGTYYAMSGFAAGGTSGGLTNAVFMKSAMSSFSSSYPAGFQGW